MSLIQLDQLTFVKAAWLLLFSLVLWSVVKHSLDTKLHLHMWFFSTGFPLSFGNSECLLMLNIKVLVRKWPYENGKKVKKISPCSCWTTRLMHTASTSDYVTFCRSDPTVCWVFASTDFDWTTVITVAVFSKQCHAICKSHIKTSGYKFRNLLTERFVQTKMLQSHTVLQIFCLCVAFFSFLTVRKKRFVFFYMFQGAVFVYLDNILLF